MVRKIIIEVKGSSENKVDALIGLLQDASDRDLRDALDSVDTPTLLSVAKAVHGRLYQRVV